MFASLFNGFGTSLFDEVRRMESEMDALFSRIAGPVGIRSVQRGTFPPINVGATPERVDVYVFAPGLDPKTIDLSLQQNLLALSGSRGVPVGENATYYRRERFDGDFRRVVTLPEDVDPERVEAKYRDGVLHVTVQRRETARPHQITVQ